MKSIRSKILMRRLSINSKGERRPVHALMELTYDCNHKCLYCYNVKDTAKKELSKSEIFSAIDQLALMGTLKLTLTGGEIFTRPDIMDIIHHARKRGFLLVLMTNAALITEEVADKLIGRGVEDFCISFPAGTKDLFDKTTQVDGSFEKVITAIKMLCETGIRPKILTCVTRINVAETDKIKDLARALGLSFKFSGLALPGHNFCNEAFDPYLNAEEYLNFKKNAVSRQNNSKIYGHNNPPIRVARKPHAAKKLKGARFWERENLFSCMAGKKAMFINPYGEAIPCLTLKEPSYDIKSEGVYGAWSKIREFVDTKRAPSDWKCYTCEYRHWCSRCPGMAYAQTGDIFGCSQFFRERAMLQKKIHEDSAAVQKIR